MAAKNSVIARPHCRVPRDIRRHIVIVSGIHLCHNPRVMKEAATLAVAGYQVTVLGAWHDAALKLRDRALMAASLFQFVPVADLTETGLRAQLPQFKRKLASIISGRTSWQNRSRLGYAYSDLRQAALRVRGDLYIAHLEQGMGVAVDLLRAGHQVAVDMEDWYSEDLLPEARRRRPITLLRRLEARLLRATTYATCPSRAMSDALAAEYGCPPSRVLYNAFPWADRRALDGAAKDRRNRSGFSIFWFSQTLGQGRGLEDLLAALPRIEHPAEIHLRGKPIPEFDNWLAARIPQEWRQRVFVHGVVPNDELLSRIAEHDLGFAGEMKYSRSRDLTVTNKILHYLLGGLAVVASDTAGQREVAAQAGDAVLLYPSGDSGALAAQINALFCSPSRLQHAKAAALAAAEATFCWERQEPVLLEAVDKALARNLV